MNMIDTQIPPRLVPALRRLETTPPRKPPHLQAGATPARPAPPPPPPVAQPAAPPTMLTLYEYFCRYCDRRETGCLPPPFWLNLRRHVVRGSLVPPPDLPKQEREVHRRRCSMGLYCSWNCLVAAMPRLGKLYHHLQEQGVGMRPLAKAPAVLPSPVTKGGPE